METKVRMIMPDWDLNSVKPESEKHDSKFHLVEHVHNQQSVT
jgi:hypothetical protein